MVLLEGRLYLNIEKYIVEFAETKEYLEYLLLSKEKFLPKYATRVGLDIHSLKLIEVDVDFKFISFLDIGNGKFAMMLQH